MLASFYQTQSESNCSIAVFGIFFFLICWCLIFAFHLNLLLFQYKMRRISTYSVCLWFFFNTSLHLVLWKIRYFECAHTVNKCAGSTILICSMHCNEYGMRIESNRMGARVTLCCSRGRILDRSKKKLNVECQWFTGTDVMHQNNKYSWFISGKITCTNTDALHWLCIGQIQR